MSNLVHSLTSSTSRRLGLVPLLRVMPSMRPLRIIAVQRLSTLVMCSKNRNLRSFTGCLKRQEWPSSSNTVFSCWFSAVSSKHVPASCVLSFQMLITVLNQHFHDQDSLSYIVVVHIKTSVRLMFELHSAH